MFDIGWPELLVIGIVLIVVVGPKDLPGMLRQFGRTTAKLKAMAGDFRKQFDEALEEAELDDVRDFAKQARKLDPRAEIRKHLSPMEKVGQDIKRGLDDAMKPKPDTSAEPAASEAHAAEPVKTGATGVPEDKPEGKKPAAGKSGKTGTAKPGTAKAAAEPKAASTSAGAAGSKSAKSNGAAALAGKSRTSAATGKAAAKKPASAGAKPATTGAAGTRKAARKTAAVKKKSGTAT